MKKITLSCFMMLLLMFVNAQLQTKTIHRKASKIKHTQTSSKVDYMPEVLNNPYNPTHNSNLINKGVQTNLKNRKPSNFKTSRNVQMPSILGGFEDVYDSYSVPNDNAIAVSNSGNIITMRNSKISFYNDSMQLVQTQSFNSFASVLNLPDEKYDPRVIYDQDENRFIVVMLSGFDYLSSQIIVSFSATDDPTGEWYFYTIPGNIFGDSTWSDFPIVALNNNELFITVTNFADMTSSDTWDFYGCRIIQMDKFLGYQGADSVNYAYHLVNPGFAESIPSTIYYYNVSPVRGGKTLYGPNMFFVSALDCSHLDTASGEFSPNDTIFLVEFTGTQYDPDFEIQSHYIHSDISYGLSIQTPQPGNHALKTGYNTIKDAIYEFNTIHFALNSIDFNNQKTGIYHGIITNPGTSNLFSCHMISFDTMGIAYPAFAFTGMNANDQSVLIGFNYSSVLSYPGNACMLYDNGNYSDVLVLKKGIGLMNMTSAFAERWGDYTTIQLKYNQPNTAYFSGSFGRAGKTQTWVSKIHVPIIGESIDDIAKNNMKPEIFPNPTSDFFTVRFEIPKMQVCHFILSDEKGNTIEKLLSKRVKIGVNDFTFNVSSLKTGVYFLQIKGDDGYISSHKIIVK